MNRLTRVYAGPMPRTRCAQCGALPQTPCETPSGTETALHAARKRSEKIYDEKRGN